MSSQLCPSWRVNSLWGTDTSLRSLRPGISQKDSQLINYFLSRELGSIFLFRDIPVHEIEGTDTFPTAWASSPRTDHRIQGSWVWWWKLISGCRRKSLWTKKNANNQWLFLGVVGQFLFSLARRSKQSVGCCWRLIGGSWRPQSLTCGAWARRNERSVCDPADEPQALFFIKIRWKHFFSSSLRSSFRTVNDCKWKRASLLPGPNELERNQALGLVSFTHPAIS